MEKLMEILKELRPDVNFEVEKKLLDEGILDSFDMVSLIGEMNEQFGADVSFDDLDAENFNSVEQMWAMITRLKAGK